MEAVRLIEQTDGLVLNLSAGGTAKCYSNVVELEYTIFRHTDAVGDVHNLPFQDEVFEGVVCLPSSITANLTGPCRRFAGC